MASGDASYRSLVDRFDDCSLDASSSFDESKHSMKFPSHSPPNVEEREESGINHIQTNSSDLSYSKLSENHIDVLNQQLNDIPVRDTLSAEINDFHSEGTGIEYVNGERISRSSTNVDEVSRIIDECSRRNANIIDLARKRLQTIPDELLNLKQVEFLYLEGNEISELPDNFLDCFPRLRWLDLRRNKLSALPGRCFVNHCCLQTLLLEDNNIKLLPLELGMANSLVGLNLRNNPVEFPPPEILTKGVKEICLYLRRLLNAQLDGRTEDIDRILLGKEELGGSEGENDGETSTITKTNSYLSKKSLSSVKSDRSGTNVVHKFSESNGTSFGPIARSAGLHRQPIDASSRNVLETRNTHKQFLAGIPQKKKSSAQKIRKTQTEKYLDPDGEKPMTTEQVEMQYRRERRLAKQREENAKIDQILQTRKTQELVKDFREEAKLLQQQKLAERRLKGKIDFEQPATKAPFGIETEDLRMLTNEERLAFDSKKREKKAVPMSPDAVRRREEMKLLQERSLEAKIRDHTKAMRERRQKQKGDPKQELAAAQRELEIAKELQREVDIRRQELEYRFSAHTVDTMHTSWPRRTKFK